MLTQISSENNSRIKLVRKLQSRKGRNEESRFVAEGINLVSELIEGAYDLDFLVVSEEFRFSDDERSETIKAYINSSETSALEINKAAFDKLTDAENGIDVLAVVKATHYGIEHMDRLPEGSCILVCDRVQDPGNMGTMIRTAVAAGYGAIVVLPGTVDIYSPKVLRATAGMVFDIPIIQASGEEEIKTAAERTGRKIVVTVPEGGRNYYHEDLTRDIMLVIGNEGRGVSEGINEMADIKVTLPMKGNVESLNAAVAAAILMYETIRG